MRLRRFSVRDVLHWIFIHPFTYRVAVLGQIPGEAAPTQYNNQVPSIALGLGHVYLNMKVCCSIERLFLGLVLILI